jgi:hypothetical protein
MGQKEVKSHKEISLFCDLNFIIYSGINLKLWNIKEYAIFLLQKNQVSQLKF